MREISSASWFSSRAGGARGGTARTTSNLILIQSLFPGKGNQQTWRKTLPSILFACGQVIYSWTRESECYVDLLILGSWWRPLIYQAAIGHAPYWLQTWDVWCHLLCYHANEDTSLGSEYSICFEVCVCVCVSVCVCVCVCVDSIYGNHLTAHMVQMTANHKSYDTIHY